MFKIIVPATSSNVGPGLDVFGLALSMHNTFIFRPSHRFKNNNLVYKAYKETFDYLGMDLVPISIQIKSHIPSTRGLGSSSTCIVAGVYAALYMIYGDVDRELAIKLAIKIEGHPDNVSPAIFGGLVVTVVDGDEIYHENFPLHQDLSFLAVIPNFSLRTAKSRKSLPDQVGLDSAIYNVSRAAMLPFALKTMDKAKLKACIDDRLHEPYRKQLIPGYDKVKKKALSFDALGVYLSGSGSTIMVLADKNSQTYMKLKGYMGVKFKKWKVERLDVNQEGAKIIK